MAVKFSARTDVGRVRERNEDNFLVDRKLQLFVVCDGMGGHRGGEIASATAVNALREKLVLHRADLDSYRQGLGGLTERDVVDLLEQGVRTANQRVYERGHANPDQAGMGTTLSALLLLGGRAFIAHVGDSRVYRMRAGQMEQLTTDHSFYDELMREHPEVAKTLDGSKLKNAVSRAVGVRATVEPDVFDHAVEAGDRFLLSSDGLHGFVEDSDVAALLAEEDLDVAAELMVRHANDAGGRDNVTVVVLEAEPEDAAATQGSASRYFRSVRALPLLRHMDDNQLWRLIGAMERRVYAPGSRLWSQGDPTDGLYLVLGGSVKVERNGRAISTIPTGQLVGTITSIDGGPRTADAQVAGEQRVTALALSREALDELLVNEPALATKLLISVSRSLASRLRRVIDAIAPAPEREARPPRARGGQRPAVGMKPSATGDPAVAAAPPPVPTPRPPALPPEALQPEPSAAAAASLAQTQTGAERRGMRKPLATPAAIGGNTQPLDLREILEVIEGQPATHAAIPGAEPEI